MTFIDRLDELMRKRGINKSTLSKESGVPYTTIAGFYAKGTDNVKLSTLRKLSSYFGCTIDYLAGDDDRQAEAFPLPGDYTPAELEEIKSFAEYVRGKRSNREVTPPNTK